MNASQLFTMALTTVSGKPEPATGVVVATGIILVFIVLIILYVLIVFQGKIFVAIENKKNGKTVDKPKVTVQAAPTAAVPKATAPMKIDAGISQEVVAAIAAAVSCVDGGVYTVKSVKRAIRTGRNAWGQAGVTSSTDPF